MDNFALTILLSLLVMGLVIAGLGIGLILTGKSRLKKGCGLSPGRRKKDDSSCPLCKGKESCHQKEEKKDEHDT